MNSKIKRILIVALAMEMLVSSIGIAQVSHLCKMALAGTEKSSCADTNSNAHACCNMSGTENFSTSKDDSCCTDQIKYFQNKVNGTLQEMYNSFPVEVVVITLLSHLVSFSEFPISQSFSNLIEYPPAEEGRQIFLSINSLLI